MRMFKIRLTPIDTIKYQLPTGLDRAAVVLRLWPKRIRQQAGLTARAVSGETDFNRSGWLSDGCQPCCPL